MTPIDQSNVRNRLLRALSPDAFSLLLPSMEAADIPLKHVLVEADEVATHVYFIETGLASVVATSRSGDEIEVGHLGREGMSGINIILHCETTPNRTFMQVAGSAIRVPSGKFSDLLADDLEAQSLFLRYVQTTQIQVAFSALANARFNMDARLARWLLMCHDRLDSDRLPLTHEFLSLMLGVRRAGVTDQIHVLEGLHAIKALRGEIHVTDRALLESIAGESYGAPEREYARLIGICSETHAPHA